MPGAFFDPQLKARDARRPGWYGRAVIQRLVASRAASWAALSLLAGTLCLGCGYKVVRYKGAIPDAERIAIGSLANLTFEPGVDRILNDALLREFQRRGALRVVDDREAADLVLEGAIAAVDIRSRSFSSIAFALEYEVRMVLEVIVTRRDGTVMEIDENSLAETDLYLASADVEVARTNRSEAIRRLSSLLAGRVHDALYERVVQ